MTVSELAKVLEELGCPSRKCDDMARQLDKKARMDADAKKISYERALQHPVGLMAQGWAATGKKQ